MKIKKEDKLRKNQEMRRRNAQRRWKKDLRGRERWKINKEMHQGKNKLYDDEDDKDNRDAAGAD